MNVKQLENEIQSYGKKISNLLEIIEKGVSVDTALPRIKELEFQQEKLRAELDQVKLKQVSNGEIKNTAKQIDDYFQHFSENFKGAPLLQQKISIKKIVQQIVVDRKKSNVQIKMFRIPKIRNPIVESIHKSISQSSVCPEQELNLHECDLTRL